MNGKIVLIVFCLLSIGAMPLFAQRNMSVAVKEAEVRSSPSFFGRVVTTLEYGTQVRVEKTQGTWIEIRLPDSRETGWVHATAMERRRIVFGASTDEVATEATSGEIALAGKGFNREVEERYSDETDLDFSLIDEMERFTLPPEELEDFVDSGGLKTPEGGRE